MDDLAARRLAILCPGYVFNTPATINRWVLSLGEKSLNIKVIVLRALVNSWTTSYRYHEALLLPCVFGCSKRYPKKVDETLTRDELAHYLVCPPLWRLVSDILEQDFSNMRPPERLGVGNVCNFDGIVLAHQMYHYLKQNRYCEVVRSRTNADTERLLESAFRFGSAAMR